MCWAMQDCGQMSQEKIKIVMGPYGQPTNEAFVEISGAGAKYKLALAKDRQIMPNTARYVEVFTSAKAEVDRQELGGTVFG